MNDFLLLNLFELITWAILTAILLDQLLLLAVSARSTSTFFISQNGVTLRKFNVNYVFHGSFVNLCSLSFFRPLFCTN